MKRILTIITVLLLTVFSGCHPTEPVEPAKPLQADIPASADLYSGETTTVQFSVINGSSGTGIQVSPAIEGITIELEYNNASGLGSLHITMSNDVEQTRTLYISITDGAERVEKDIELRLHASQHDDNFLFEDGTRSKAFDFLEHERVFHLKTNKEYSNIEVIIPEGEKAWVEYVREGNDGFCFHILGNDGDTARTVHIEITKGPNNSLTLDIRQIGSQMRGSLRYGLMALYNATNGSEWYSRTYWGTNKPLIEWDNLRPEHEETLALFGNDKKKAYSGTDNLWEFDNHLNELKGYIPEEFWEIVSYLSVINLHSYRNLLLEEEIPDILWHKNLRKIELYNTNLYGNASLLYNCPLLESVNIYSDIEFEGNKNLTLNLTDELLNLTNLECFEFGNGNISGTLPNNISRLKNLKQLRLGGGDFNCTLSDEIYELTELTKIKIWSPNITGTLSPKIQNLKNLEEILIQGCLEGTIPEELGLLMNLRYVELEHNCFTNFPEFFRYFPADNGKEWPYVNPMGPVSPCIMRDKETGEYFYLPTPKWHYERYGGRLENRAKIFPHYPYASDLQYPADEYYYDGKDWRHPNYEYPARYYHKVNGTWTYDPDWNWNDEYIE